MSNPYIPHFLNKSTSLPISQIKRNNWFNNGLYKDHVSFAHYIADLFGYKKYLVLNCLYGTYSEVLIKTGKTVVSIDETEEEFDVLPLTVQNSFRLADITSPSVFLGLFDIVTGIDLTYVFNSNQFSSFINFVCKHANFYVIFLIQNFVQLRTEWIQEFEKHHFQYDQEKTNNIFSLNKKLLNLQVLGTLVFQNTKPKVEVSDDAGTSETT